MYYTYTHSIPDGKVFYVGKGKEGRAYSTSDRTLAWRKVVEDNQGVTMKIVKHFENEDDAFAHEIELITQFKDDGCKLVNLTSGGKGVMDYCFTEENRLSRSKALTGYKHKEVICPHCATVGGETSMKRWHFDNCTGVRPEHKSRTTINGSRLYLGKFHTKAEADDNAQELKELVLSEIASQEI